MRITTGIMRVALVIGLIAIALFGLGLPALAIDGPTPPQVSDPAQIGGYPEIQSVSLGDATGGTFDMYLDSSCSWVSAIPWNETAGNLQTALNASCAGAVVTVSGAAGGPWTITFQIPSVNDGWDMDPIVVNAGALTPAVITPVVATAQNGVNLTSPDVSPHGGFSTQTNFCLQCHQVHNYRAGTTAGGPNGDIPGEYALMAESSVTSTCATCHGFEGAAPTGAEDPGFGGTIATASLRAVYTQPEEVHIIGATLGGGGNPAAGGMNAGWDFYTWVGNGSAGTQGPEAPSATMGSAGQTSYYNGGLYCGSCHTPHGEFGQLINSKWAVTTANQAGGNPTTQTPTAVAWEDGSRIWFEDPTPSGVGVPVNLNGDPWKQAYLKNAGTYWEVCGTRSAPPAPYTFSDCETALKYDAEGQLVSLYGYKLLTTSPNHQYPWRNNDGQFLNSDGTLVGGTGTVPPSGLYSDAPFGGGSLANALGSPNYRTDWLLGSLTANINGAVLSFDVLENPNSSGTFYSNNGPFGVANPLPFKIRIDEEIFMVTNRVLLNPDPATAPQRTYTYTVVRAVEPVEPELACRPWGGPSTNGVPACIGAAHSSAAAVTIVPTMLVTEPPGRSVADVNNRSTTNGGAQGGIKPYNTSAYSASWVKTPFHVEVPNSNNSNTEKMVVLWRTPTTVTDQYLYTVGRAVDGTVQVPAPQHVTGNAVTILSGVQRNSIRSWGVDRQDGDMSNFCGSCHGGPVDRQFGGQYHSHPTGCATCHGNSATSGNDFPHSSDQILMLQAIPDGLCLNCHVAGTLP